MHSTVSGENIEVVLVSVILFCFARFGCFGGFVSLFRVFVHAVFYDSIKHGLGFFMGKRIADVSMERVFLQETKCLLAA